MVTPTCPPLADRKLRPEAFASAHQVTGLLRVGTWTHIFQLSFQNITNILPCSSMMYSYINLQLTHKTASEQYIWRISLLKNIFSSPHVGLLLKSGHKDANIAVSLGPSSLGHWQNDWPLWRNVSWKSKTKIISCKCLPSLKVSHRNNLTTVCLKTAAELKINLAKINVIYLN